MWANYVLGGMYTQPARIKCLKKMQFAKWDPTFTSLDQKKNDMSLCFTLRDHKLCDFEV